MKLTYTEQYRHPQWQRRRLERMQLANYKCENCEETEITLNVHHKLYVKGRMVWEYPDHELAVLCEPCHEYETIARAALAVALAPLDSNEIERLTGYADGWAMQKAWHYEQRVDDPKVESGEYANGLADALRIEWIDIMRLAATDGHIVSADILKRLYDESHQRRMAENPRAFKG